MDHLKQRKRYFSVLLVIYLSSFAMAQAVGCRSVTLEA
jgi:hypothetical protein